MLRNTTLAVILIAALGFAVYGNSLSGKFVWDDCLLISNNSYIEPRSPVYRLFTQTTTAGIGEREGFYRPLQMLTYRLNYFLWGLNPGGYHLTNIILHILAAIAVYFLTVALFTGRLLGFFSAVFFTIHPVHTEAVAYISGRADILAALFLLLCLIFYIKNIHSPKLIFSILVFAAYLCALLSKESSLIFAALLLLYHYFFGGKPKAKEFTLIVGLSLVYIFLRYVTFREFLPRITVTSNILQRIPGFFCAITQYASLLLLPLGLRMEYGKALFGLDDPRVIIGFILTCALLGAAYLTRKNNKLVSFSIFWFFLALLPCSNLYPLNGYMAEHWLYLPSLGFFLLLARALCFLCGDKKLKIIGITLSAGLIIFYAYLTIRQNRYWSDNIMFFRRQAEYPPASARVYYNLGLSYDLEGRRPEAIAAYKMSIQVDPGYFLAHNNLAVVYAEMGSYDLAIKHCDRALQLGYPVHPGLLEQLAPHREKTWAK